MHGCSRALPATRLYPAQSGSGGALLFAAQLQSDQPSPEQHCQTDINPHPEPSRFSCDCARRGRPTLFSDTTVVRSHCKRYSNRNLQLRLCRTPEPAIGARLAGDSRCFSGVFRDFVQVNYFPPCAATTGIQLTSNFEDCRRCNICTPTTVRQFTQLNTFRAGCGAATSKLF